MGENCNEVEDSSYRGAKANDERSYVQVACGISVRKYGSVVEADATSTELPDKGKSCVRWSLCAARRKRRVIHMAGTRITRIPDSWPSNS